MKRRNTTPPTTRQGTQRQRSYTLNECESVYMYIISPYSAMLYPTGCTVLCTIRPLFEDGSAYTGVKVMPGASGLVSRWWA